MVQQPAASRRVIWRSSLFSGASTFRPDEARRSLQPGLFLQDGVFDIS
jgi:hypothetical protein